MVGNLVVIRINELLKYRIFNLEEAGFDEWLAVNLTARLLRCEKREQAKLPASE
ncbi:hypothetical protein IMPR6_20010 [Imperialibacter sp. EC-SDR9]|nr:hypothetical protein IMPERIA75_420278 [Imperialibacter sp. 75]CAD5295973.1 hypothetical protein IMPERIA89_660276 [Imperialibacter sp. 89]VVT11610.1 hypothetical protein IMPR6_20010 [Imperialibacter sp. EC-SDR9]